MVSSLDASANLVLLVSEVSELETSFNISSRDRMIEKSYRIRPGVRSDQLV